MALEVMFKVLDIHAEQLEIWVWRAQERGLGCK